MELTITVCAGVRSHVLKISAADTGWVNALSDHNAAAARESLLGKPGELGFWRVVPAGPVLSALDDLSTTSGISSALSQNLAKLRRFLKSTKPTSDIWIGVG